MTVDIGYDFKDEKLLRMALTHSSYAHENGSKDFNERLEFLGDAVLELLISDYLYNRYPDESEGNLTRLRAGLVCEGSLAALSRKIRLDRELYFGHGEEMTGGRNRDSILADALEALIGAVYLDGGLEVARKFVLGIFDDILKNDCKFVTDYKTYLQEVLQRDNKESAVYAIVNETGPDHEKIFTASVSFNGEVLGTGEGKSKKDAEQKAAYYAIQKLNV
ncbi:MAG: ribonuclease III [Defluviitaleaceae bacterium]|nr:ribonuclease III [Defluviitaleaceae bacterium]